MPFGDSRPIVGRYWATLLLVVLLHVVFAIEAAVVASYGEATWSQVFELQPGLWPAWGVLLNVVAHQSIGHLLGNVAFLLPVAILVEPRVGGPRLLAIFFGIGILAASVQTFAADRSSLGASGGVAALAGCALVMAWSSDGAPAREAEALRRWAWRIVTLAIALGLLVWAIVGLAARSTEHGHLAHLFGLVAGAAIGVAVAARKVEAAAAA